MKSNEIPLKSVARELLKCAHTSIKRHQTLSTSESSNVTRKLKSLAALFALATDADTDISDTNLLHIFLAATYTKEYKIHMIHSNYKAGTIFIIYNNMLVLKFENE